MSELFRLHKSFSRTADLEELRGEQPYKLKSRDEMKLKSPGLWMSIEDRRHECRHIFVQGKESVPFMQLYLCELLSWLSKSWLQYLKGYTFLIVSTKTFQILNSKSPKISDIKNEHQQLAPPGRQDLLQHNNSRNNCPCSSEEGFKIININIFSEISQCFINSWGCEGWKRKEHLY